MLHTYRSRRGNHVFVLPSLSRIVAAAKAILRVALLRTPLMGPKNPEDDKLRPDANETAFNVVNAAVGDGPRPIPPENRTEGNKMVNADRILVNQPTANPCL